MWGLRFLNGPLAGTIVPLKVGVHRLGRNPGCSLQIAAPGVSKEHLELTVQKDKILFTDLNSANGTYLNGVKSRGGLVRLGDKVGLHNILFEIVPHVGNQVVTVQRKPMAPRSTPFPTSQGHLTNPGHFSTPDYGQINENHVQRQPLSLGEKIESLNQKSQDFLEQVLLPGVYHLPQVMSFRQVILGFIGIYIFLVTLISIVPMKVITSEAIQNESLRRALTVARALASANERIIRSNDLASFSIESIIKEEGVTDIYVVSREGTILAPPERTGSVPRETGFVRKIRGQPQEYTESLLGGQLGAAVPILVFDPELQQNSAKAHAVVIYNPGSLAYDDGRAFSLFIQMLFLASIIGGILFFFLYKLIEHPFKLLNSELDSALREGRDQASLGFNLPVLQNLMTNINSLLARAAAASAMNAPLAGKGARDQEIANLMQMIGYPSILLSREGLIARISPSFEALTGIPSDKILNQRISEIPDAAMQQNFQHLMNQSLMNLNQLCTDTLELGGHQFTLTCQALTAASGEVEYHLISISPLAQEGAA